MANGRHRSTSSRRRCCRRSRSTRSTASHCILKSSRIARWFTAWESTATTTTAPTAEGEAATTVPEVQAQSPQAQTQVPPSGSDAGNSSKGAPGPPGVARHGRKPRGGSSGAQANGKTKAKDLAPAALPSALTPPFPSSLGSAIGWIPEFFIESFRVPPFLLPIYQAAGAAYGIPWQVIAAITELFDSVFELTDAGALLASAAPNAPELVGLDERVLDRSLSPASSHLDQFQCGG